MTPLKIGMWIWGGITVTLAISSLALVLIAGWHMDSAGNMHGLCRIAGLYKAISSNGSLVAGILGFSGLAWTHFFQAAGKSEPRKPRFQESIRGRGQGRD